MTDQPAHVWLREVEAQLERVAAGDRLAAVSADWDLTIDAMHAGWWRAFRWLLEETGA